MFGFSMLASGKEGGKNYTRRCADVTKDLRKDEFAGLDAYFQKGKLAASNSEASVSQYAKS